MSEWIMFCLFVFFIVLSIWLLQKKNKRKRRFWHGYYMDAFESLEKRIAKLEAKDED